MPRCTSIFHPPPVTIWCPFDTEDSLFVKLFRQRGYTVIATHIANGQDFFAIDPPKCDYIISNPPYSLKGEVFERLFQLNIPFAMLGCAGFQCHVRWKSVSGFQHSRQTGGGLHGLVSIAATYIIPWKLTMINATIALSADQLKSRRPALPYWSNGCVS